jgi:hypothetical protein
MQCLFLENSVKLPRGFKANNDQHWGRAVGAVRRRITQQAPKDLHTQMVFRRPQLPHFYPNAASAAMSVEPMTALWRLMPSRTRICGAVKPSNCLADFLVIKNVV